MKLLYSCRIDEILLSEGKYNAIVKKGKNKISTNRKCIAPIRLCINWLVENIHPVLRVRYWRDHPKHRVPRIRIVWGKCYRVTVPLIIKPHTWRCICISIGTVYTEDNFLKFRWYLSLMYLIKMWEQNVCNFKCSTIYET